MVAPTVRLKKEVKYKGVMDSRESSATKQPSPSGDRAARCAMMFLSDYKGKDVHCPR